MPHHLIKLCVGVDAVDDLERSWQRRLAQQRRCGLPQQLVHKTRRAPRRSADVLAGGSLYWVIKGVISVRQRILDLQPDVDDDGRACCAIHLDTVLVRTEAFPHRPFQGWRYLDPSKAPPDRAAGSGDQPPMPPAMVAELRSLGLL